MKLPVTELRTLLERFANGTSMDIMFDTVNVLIDDARRDDGLRHWFQSVDAYIRKVRKPRKYDALPLILYRFSLNLDMFSNRTATTKQIASANQVACISTTNIVATLTICSVALANGSRLWAKIL